MKGFGKYTTSIEPVKNTIITEKCDTLNFKDATTLFKSSILCYFDHGSLFYNSANQSHSKHLQVLQNTSLRIIFVEICTSSGGH